MRVDCRHPANADLCERLERIAELLEAQDASPFRVAAYRGAAATLGGLEDPVADRFEQGGVEALEALPRIGRGIASLLREYLRSGHISLLDRLTGHVAAEDVLATIPGLGPTLARRVHEELGVDTLEQLECACADGRLAGLQGFGARRVEAIAAAVGARLGRRSPRGARPSVAALLDVDRGYRDGVRHGRLPRIAPRRFNPQGRAWLPVLHTQREGWELTALFSNTARAHRLGRTHDWVVIYGDRDGQHDQCTVVSEPRGASTHRIVRGRELETREAG